MNIVIFTHRRPDKQITYNDLPSELKKHTTIICDEQDKIEIQKKFPDANFLIYPEDVKGIAQKRIWYVKTFPKKVIMLDDDMVFQHRYWVEDVQRWRLKGNTPEQTIQAFEMMWNKLDNYAHVGISARMTATRQGPDSFAENSKLVSVLGFRGDVVKRVIDLENTVSLKEDYDWVLSLLKAGYPNRVLVDFCQSQGSFNAAGGCSTYRTNELRDQCTRDFAEKHSDVVKLKEKQYKNETRLEVMCYWKKAWKIGVKNNDGHELIFYKNKEYRRKVDI